jgi:hypothetical protein
MINIRVVRYLNDTIRDRSDTVDMEDYARAVEEVHKLGLDPDDIPHYKPAKG